MIASAAHPHPIFGFVRKVKENGQNLYTWYMSALLACTEKDENVLSRPDRTLAFSGLEPRPPTINSPGGGVKHGE